MIETKLKDIVEYWAAKTNECGLGVDWAEAHYRCWRCGYKSSLQRCHIIPHSLGGLDHPSNLVLLCVRCHREAPNHSNPKYMWIWLRATCASFYDTYWIQRGLKEFETMFKRKPFSTFNQDKIDFDKVFEMIGIEMKNTIIHFGEGRLNPSTIACVISEVEEKLTKTNKN